VSADIGYLDAPAAAWRKAGIDPDVRVPVSTTESLFGLLQATGGREAAPIHLWMEFPAVSLGGHGTRSCPQPHTALLPLEFQWPANRREPCPGGD